MQLIGTAGHIDHGKSALIKSLTGIHPSRLPEEKKRGMTLDLGYAFLKRPDGETIGFIDVPGHEKLIKNMAAGATGIGIALLVVDSREGPKNQTIEHLNILRLLGVGHIIPVLTKISGCPDNQLTESERKLRTLIVDSGLSSSPIMKVDSLDQTGIPDLKMEVIKSSTHLQTDKSNWPIYLPIDRSFSLKGIGTVITGTLYQGTLKKDQKVTITGISEPVRIKSIHNHNIEVSSISAGHRVGLHPAGIRPEQINRGQVIVDPENTSETNRINVNIELLKDSPIEIKTGSSFLFYSGTSESVCRLYLTSKNSENKSLKILKRGNSAIAQIILENSISFFCKQPFLIRSTMPLVTIAGGKVVDCNPDLKRKTSPAEESAYFLLPDSKSAILNYIRKCEEKSIDLAKLNNKFLVSRQDILTQITSDSSLITDEEKGKLHDHITVSTVEKMEDSKKKLISVIQKSNDTLKTDYSFIEIADILELPEGLVRKYFIEGKSKKIVFSRNSKSVELNISSDKISLLQPSLQFSSTEKEVKEKILTRLKKEGLQSTFYANFKKSFSSQLTVFNKMLKHLEETGPITRVNKDYFILTVKYQDLLNILNDYANTTFTVSEFGKAAGISRKFSIPLLEHLDTLGVTKRDGVNRNIDAVKLRARQELS